MKRLLAAVALAAVAAMAVVQPASAGRHVAQGTVLRNGLTCTTVGGCNLRSHRGGGGGTTTVIQGGSSAFGLGSFGTGGVDLGTALLLGALSGGGNTGLTGFSAQSGINPLLLLLGQSALAQPSIIIQQDGGRRHHGRRN